MSRPAASDTGRVSPPLRPDAPAARALARLLARAATVREGDRAVPSPCVSICRMDAATRWCEGCLRDIDEIAGWSQMDDAARVAVWRRIEQRADRIRSIDGPRGH